MYNASEINMDNPSGYVSNGQAKFEELKITHDGIVVKFIPDLKSHKDGKNPPLFLTSYQYKHQAGPSPADTRSHPGLKIIVGEDPEFEAFLLLNKEVSAHVKETGLKGDALKNDSTFQQLKAKADFFKPKNTVLMIAYERGASKPKVLRLTETMKNKLFGKPATDKAPAERGLIREMMQDEQLNPFDLNQDGGWVRLYKTGEGFGTEYFAEIYKTKQVINGKKGDFACEEPTPPSILSLIKEDLPDLVAFHSQYHWSLEETKEYVSSFLETGKAILPEKALLKQYRTAKNTGGNAFQKATQYSAPVKTEAVKTEPKATKASAAIAATDDYDDLNEYLNS